MSWGYTNVIAKIPPGTLGVAELIHDTPSPLDRLRGAMHGQPLTRSKYARLIIRGECYMTDAEFERETNAEFLEHASGDVLIAGLGIGLILDPVLEHCSSVTVVEKEPDVVALIGPHFTKCNIICADIFEWEPPKGTKYHAIYFDIWPDICGDDSDEAARLHKKFRKYLNKGGWMRSWTTIAQRALGVGR